jgi:2-(1,2-epoxy-1,2-dihydrophenyl)acetyl-CoA isomerase
MVMMVQSRLEAREELPALRLQWDGSVLVVTLDRPERLNALNAVLLDSLRSVAELAAGADVRAVVLTGAGRGFCAGADLRETTGDGPHRGVAMIRERYNPTVEALVGLRKPVIAAVNGPAAGAGLALACLADVRIASAKARFVPAFAQFGVVPDFGASYFIPRILGSSRAAEWLMSCEELDAGTALGWRLVSDVVAPESLIDRAVRRAHEIAEFPATAIGRTKTLVQRSLESSLHDQLEAEAVAQEAALESPERLAARDRVVAALRGGEHSGPAGDGRRSAGR